MNARAWPLIRRDRDADRPEAKRVVAVLYDQIGEINKLVAGEKTRPPSSSWNACATTCASPAICCVPTPAAWPWPLPTR